MRRTFGLIVRLLIIVALAACVGALLYGDLRDFFVQRDYQYYEQEPLRLLWPLGIAFGAGGLIWLYTSLRGGLRRRLKLVGWGLANTLGLAAAGYFGWLSVRSFQVAGTPMGAVAGESAGSGSLKYIAAVLALLLLVVSAESWRRLLRHLRGR